MNPVQPHHLYQARHNLQAIIQRVNDNKRWRALYTTTIAEADSVNDGEEVMSEEETDQEQSDSHSEQSENENQQEMQDDQNEEELQFSSDNEAEPVDEYNVWDAQDNDPNPYPDIPGFGRMMPEGIMDGQEFMRDDGLNFDRCRYQSENDLVVCIKKPDSTKPNK